MARMRDRIFAGFGAALFLISAVGVTAFAVMQGGGSAPKATDTSQQSSCVDNETEAALDAPEVYKPEGDVTTLEKTDLTEGTGATAKTGDCLVMKYYGTLASDGTKFDEDFTDTSGFAFVLGQGQVIQGWEQGIAGMKEGGLRRLVIPSDLAYGEQAQGSIPANADLVFVVKLLRIQK